MLLRALQLHGFRNLVPTVLTPGSGFNVPWRNHFRVTLLPEAPVLREVFARIDRLLSRRASASASASVAAA